MSRLSCNQSYSVREPVRAVPAGMLPLPPLESCRRFNPTGSLALSRDPTSSSYTGSQTRGRHFPSERTLIPDMAAGRFLNRPFHASILQREDLPVCNQPGVTWTR